MTAELKEKSRAAAASGRSVAAAEPSGPRRQKSRALPAASAPPAASPTANYVVPDGGYGWVIVLCSFVFICLPMGIGSTFGLYYEEWLVYFGAGKVATALVGSIAAGCIPVLGALAGMVLNNVVDTRMVGIIGCVVSGVAMLLASFANSIAVLALTYGALAGLGLGLMFNSAYLIVARYFDKNRPAATAIASSGTGFGTLFAIMLRYFIQEYHWRGSLILLGGVCLQAIVFGALMRPLKALPSADDKASVNESRPPFDSRSNVRNGTGGGGTTRMATVSATPSEGGKHSHVRSKELARVLLELAREQQHGSGGCGSSSSQVLPGIGLERDGRLYGSGIYGMSEFSSVLSVCRITNVATVRVPAADGRSFASVATMETIAMDTAGRCSQIRQSFKRSFSLEVLRNRYFLLITSGLTLHHMAFFIPYTYVISLTRAHGVDQRSASYLILTFGLANFALKLAIGALTMVYKRIDQLYVVCLSLALSAAAAAVTTYCTQYWQFVILCIIYGGMSPIVTIYVTSLLVKYLGSDNLTSSFSMATLVRGFGTIAGPPIAGKVIDMTGMTEAAFYVGTAADVVALLCFIAVIVVDRNDPKFIAKRADESATAAKAAEAAAAGRDTRRAALMLSVPQIIVTCPTMENLAEEEQPSANTDESVAC